jgi:hypothetical protein
MVKARFLPLACALFLCSCDVNLFGWKAVAGGYWLDDWREGEPAYILFPPSDEPGQIRVQELGWKKPFILVRPEGSTAEWIVIDTRTKQRVTISDTQREADPIYRDIAVYPASEAWTRLRRTKQW